MDGTGRDGNGIYRRRRNREALEGEERGGKCSIEEAIWGTGKYIPTYIYTYIHTYTHQLPYLRRSVVWKVRVTCRGMAGFVVFVRLGTFVRVGVYVVLATPALAEHQVRIARG